MDKKTTKNSTPKGAIRAKRVESKTKKRVGRGIAAGQGMTAGRGTKGQRSRSGFNLPKRFEGGQTPLSMRLPKLRGFKVKQTKCALITLDEINQNYKDGETVSHQSLVKKGLVRKNESIKILNNGKLTVKVTLLDVPASKTALKHFETKAEPKKAISKSKADKR